MFYSIDAVQPTGVLTLDTLANVSEAEAFDAWEDIVMDAHGGYEIDMGHRGWAALNAGDVIRLIAYSVYDGVVDDGKILYSETNSARATKRRMF